MNPALAARLREAAEALKEDLPEETGEIQCLEGDYGLDQRDLYISGLLIELAEYFDRSRDHDPATCSALEGVDQSIRRHLDNLQFKSTGRDPKANGFAYAEVPDWALRQWLNRIEIAQGRGVQIVGSEAEYPALQCKTEHR